MLPLVDDPPPPILPLRVLTPLLAVCLGGSWYMVPKKGELIERLFKDKQYERVVAVLQDDVHGMKAGEMTGLRHLSATQLTSLSRLLNLTPREQLHAIFAAKNAPEYDAYVHNIALAAIKYVDVLAPEEAFHTIAPAVSRVPDAYRMPLLLTLAHNGQAVGRLDIASQALTLAAKCDGADWNIAREMAQCYRWNSQPGKAAHELRGWLVSHRPKLDEMQQNEAREISISLALESGNPGEAFDLCVLEMRDASQRGNIPADLMNTALDLALQSSRTKEMLPWLHKAIAAMPESTMPLPELRRLAASNADRVANYSRWATPFSRWSDWNEDYDIAFDCHLRLAVLGDAESRDRCVELYDFLGRTEECCQMLQALGDLDDKAELKLPLARMLAELGRDDEAKKLYLAWLATHPADRQAHYDVACLLEDMGDEAGSRTAFEEMVKRFPHDAPAIKRLANACIRDADYTRALALYDSLPESEHDHDTLENFAMLAESLDDHAAELRALQLTAKQMDEPSVDIYLDMADTASYLPDNQVPVQVLRDALKVLPDSAQLRIALATQHLRNDEPNEALIVLTDERLRSNFDAIETLLGMSAYITDAPRVLAFLGNDIEKRFPLTSANRLQLAVIEYNGGRIADSERLFAGVPEQPENLQALAEARFHTGNYEESARLMAGYLKSHPQAKANDWLFLGDIYEQLGMFEEARKAYDYSLALLTADLPVTASNQPRGAE